MSKKDDISDFSVSCLFQNRLKHIYIYIHPFLATNATGPEPVFQVHDLDSYVTPGPGTYNAHTTSFVY